MFLRLSTAPDPHSRPSLSSPLQEARRLVQTLGLTVLPDPSVMSWLSWTSLVPTLLVLSASLAWWFTEPKNARINLIAAAGAALFCWAVAPELCRDLSYSAYVVTVDAIAALRLELFLLRNAKMLVTGIAVVWYVNGRVCSSCPFFYLQKIPFVAFCFL